MGGIAPAGTIPPEPSGARPKRPRGFSRGPERETSESEAGVAARLMRRDGRSSGAGFPANRSREHISRDRRNNRQRVSVPHPEPGAESLRWERINRSPAGRGQKGRAAFPVDRSREHIFAWAMNPALAQRGEEGPPRVFCGGPPERFFSKGRSGLHFLPGKMDQPSASNDRAGHLLGAARPATVFLRYERSDSFLSRTSDSAAVPIFFPGSNRRDLFSRGDFSSSVNWRSDPMRPADQRGSKGRECLCLSRAVLCGNAKRTEARCGARIAGTNLSPEGRPPSPRSSPQRGRGCTPVAWRCWPAQGHWRRSNPVRSRSRARARPWPKCPTCHSRHVAFVRAPHRLNGHRPSHGFTSAGPWPADNRERCSQI
jgi:hypothetical protein